MLKSNLTRLGTDLAFETDLLYLDVANSRIGINKAIPTVPLDVVGVVNFNAGATHIGLQLTGTDTFQDIYLVNSGGAVRLRSNNDNFLIAPNGTNTAITVNGTDQSSTFSGDITNGSLRIAGNQILTDTTNENIVLAPAGTGYVIGVTPPASDNTTKLATTAYVQTELGGITVNQIVQLDTSITATDTGSDGTLTFDTDGTTALTITGGASPVHTVVGVIAAPDGSFSSPPFTNTGNTNTGIYFPATDAVGITAGNSEGLRVGGNGKVYIKESSNASMTTGLTINQGTASDEILALKSSSDITHGMTTLAETDTYFSIRKLSDTVGGTQIRSFSDTTGISAFEIAAYDGGTPDTTDTSASYGIISLSGSKANGTGNQVAAATENIMSIDDGSSTRWLIKGNGDIHQIAGDYTLDSGTVTATTFSGALSGNATTATSAAGWTTGRTITLTGDATGVSAAWDGTGNISFATVVGNDTHTHDANNLTGTILNSGVVTSSLTTVGVLGSGSISSGFGNIDNGSSTLSTGAATFTGELTMSVTDAISAAGTTQGAATALTTTFNRVTTVVSASAEAVVLPTAVAGRVIYILNADAVDTLKIFPATSDDINDGAANASTDLGPGARIMFVAVDATSWYGFYGVYA